MWLGYCQWSAIVYKFLTFISFLIIHHMIRYVCFIKFMNDASLFLMFTNVSSSEIETYEKFFVNTGDNKLVAWTNKVNDMINIEYINKISFIVFISRMQGHIFLHARWVFRIIWLKGTILIRNYHLHKCPAHDPLALLSIFSRRQVLVNTAMTISAFWRLTMILHGSYHLTEFSMVRNASIHCPRTLYTWVYSVYQLNIFQVYFTALPYRQ